MKKGKKVILLTLFCVMSAVFFWGCGGNSPGAPGSSGSSDTGIITTVTAVTHSDPSGDQGDIWEVDIAGGLCPDGTTIEAWGNDYAHVTFHGESLNPNVVSTNELFVTNYTVTFFKANPNLPTIEQISFASQTGIFVLPGTDSGPFNFLIMDTGRKVKLQNDISSGINNVSTPLHYNMKIEMWGQDKYGNTTTFPPIERVIDINDWNHCQ